MSRTYLISKYLDPILGIATGILAYQLHESNPRTAPPVGEDLRSLMRWKQNIARHEEQVEMEQWNEIVRQLNLNDDTQSGTVLPAESGPTRAS
ncbi:unnamed protein product [Rhizoctonia solani]|uniref:Non-classical export protein 1 n=1 Tax=Rhizoctonia solani TaxID=456999 RepID=A0A8H7LHF2_9AGAM